MVSQTFTKTLRLFYAYAKPYRYRILGGILALFVVDALNVFPALILKQFIDAVAKTVEGSKSFLYFAWLGTLYLMIALGQAIARYFWRVLLINSSYQAVQKLREDYFDKLQKLPPTFFDHQSIGDLMSLGTNDVEAVRMALGAGLLVFMDSIFLLLLIPPAMFFLSWKLALISLAPMIMVPYVIIRTERLIHERFEKVQEWFSKLSAFAQENIQGIRVIKAFAREMVQVGRFSTLGREFIRHNMSLCRQQSIFDPVFTLVMSLGLVCLFAFAGPDVVAGIVSLGTFVAFTRYLDQLVWPMMAMGYAVTYYQKGKSSLERIMEVLRYPVQNSEGVSPIQSGMMPHEGGVPDREIPLLLVKDLSFFYPGSTIPALAHIHFEINKGERIALVGPIGSAKSTLVKILTGFYPVSPGVIFLNGIDFCQIPLKDRRTQITAVPQDSFLFMEPLGWNVAIGSLEENVRDFSDSKIMKCLEEAKISSEARAWGLSATIGERGINLSGGQRSRVALARALARDAKLIILDDVLSGLDAGKEWEILEEQLRHRSHQNPEQALIMITHRMARVHEFDRVMVLKEGHLLEWGTPEELLKQNSLFRQMVELQRIEDELAG